MVNIPCPVVLVVVVVYMYMYLYLLLVQSRCVPYRMEALADATGLKPEPS